MGRKRARKKVKAKSSDAYTTFAINTYRSFCVELGMREEGKSKKRETD